MNISLLVFAAVFTLLLFPASARCELERRTYFDDSLQSLLVYKRPKLKPPLGWVEHDAAGQEMHGTVLIRPSQSNQGLKATIFATAIPKEEPAQQLYSFIVSDIDSFRKNSNFGKVIKTESLTTVKGETYTYTYSYKNDEGNQYIQTVAFTSEDDYFLRFVLTGRSKQAHDNAYKTFRELLAAYR
jgi:hypothetical protein